MGLKDFVTIFSFVTPPPFWGVLCFVFLCFVAHLTFLGFCDFCFVLCVILYVIYCSTVWCYTFCTLLTNFNFVFCYFFLRMVLLNMFKLEVLVQRKKV
jgi:hypothetical protein